MTQIRALFVASEVAPFAKTGGLADVVAALPAALAAEDVACRVMVPGYPGVMAALRDAKLAHDFNELFGGAARLIAAKAGPLELLALDAPHLYARSGIYGEGGADYPDNAFRFAALAYAASAVGQGTLENWRPDVVHAHDWQAGLTPAYLHYGVAPRPVTVMTLHNIAFQGKFPKDLLAALSLPDESFAIDGVEYYGDIGYLKAGLQFCDHITTVSPSYAEEITTAEFGMGLEGLLRARAHHLSGILNGVETRVWDPASDPRIPARYDAKTLATRAKNKSALQQRLRLVEDENGFLIGVVSRLSWQKGLDLLLEALPALVEDGAQFALLGAGDKALEESFTSAAKVSSGRLGVAIGYDEDLAHLIQAGADAFAVPSRFEPCGLTQLYALRYGAVPVVSRVGGLADTIIDANEMALQAGVATGVQFSPATSDALRLALLRAKRLYDDKPLWRRLQMNGMKTDVSWKRPARRYADLYRKLLSSRAG